MPWKRADRAAAIRVFAAKQGWSQEQKARIAEIEVRAAVRLGELLRETEKQQGARGIGVKVEFPTGTPLADLGVTRKQFHRAQLAASVPAKDREAYIASARDNGERLSLEKAAGGVHAAQLCIMHSGRARLSQKAA